MKKLCLFVFTILLSFPVFSQLKKGDILLKDGTLITGKYQYTDGKIQIFTGRNLLLYDAAEVDTISRKDLNRFDVDFQKDSPLFFHVETGLLIGNSQNSQTAPFSLTGSVNYKFSKKFSIGAGIGAEFYKESYLPLFVNFEYKLREYSSPYFFLKAGYLVALEDGRAVYYNYPYYSSSFIWGGYYNHENLEAMGGVLLNPGIGYSFMFRRGFGLSLAIGYQFHRLQYEAEDENYRLDIDYNRLSVKVGILFN